MERSKGYYLVIEGLDGAGKSTAIAVLKEQFEKRGFEVELVREPGGTEIAEELRTIIKKVRDYKVEAVTELLLFSAARRDLYVRKVLPALEDGKIVISDRSVITMLAYQGIGHGQLETVKKALELVYPEGHGADLCVTLDVDPETGLKRAAERAALDGTKCRIELESIEFFKKARQAFLDPELVGLFAKELVVFDTSATLEYNVNEYEKLVSRIAYDLETRYPR